MKKLLPVLLAFLAITSSAQMYRMVNGRIYRSDDLSVWRTFQDLQIVSIHPDGDLEVREISSYNQSYQVGGMRRNESDNTMTTYTTYGEPFRLINYRCYQAPYPGMDLGMVKAMLVPVVLSAGVRTVTMEGAAMSSSINGTNASVAAGTYFAHEQEIDSTAYDVGVPWYPPQPVFTKAQIAEQKAIATSNIVVFLKQQATNGMPDQQCELGERYLKGDGVPQDEDVAMMWLHKAANGGSLEASNVLQQIALTNSVTAQK